LLAGALIELLGKVAARGRESANGFEERVTARDPRVALAAAVSVRAGRHETELGGTERREK
jgi:hypothetical protein